MDSIYISADRRLEIVQYEEPAVNLGNFVNNALPSDWAPDEVANRLLVPYGAQDYRVLNCRLPGQHHPTSNSHTYRMQTTMKVPYGHELLGPYGTKYKAGHRAQDWPGAKGVDWTKEDWDAQYIHSDWPATTSRS